MCFMRVSAECLYASLFLSFSLCSLYWVSLSGVDNLKNTRFLFDSFSVSLTLHLSFCLSVSLFLCLCLCLSKEREEKWILIFCLASVFPLLFLYLNCCWKQHRSRARVSSSIKEQTKTQTDPKSINPQSSISAPSRAHFATAGSRVYSEEEYWLSRLFVKERYLCSTLFDPIRP